MASETSLCGVCPILHLGKTRVFLVPIFFCRNAGNFLPFCAPAATTAVQNSGERTANYFAIFVAQLCHAFDKQGAQNTHEVRTYTISTPFRLCAPCDAVKTADSRQKNPPPDTGGGRQRVSPDDSCLRCCYAGPICRTDIVKTTPMTGQNRTGCAIVIPSHATLSQLPSGQDFTPTPC